MKSSDYLTFYAEHRSLEVSGCPFANLPEQPQIDEFSSAQPTAEENSQDGAISFTFTLSIFHATDAGSELRAQEPGIRRLVGKSVDGRQTYVYCAWSQHMRFRKSSVVQSTELRS